MTTGAQVNPLEPGEFRLISVSVTGLKHHDFVEDTTEIQLGTPVTLRPEPENEYDEYAVAVWIGEKKLGYVPNNQGMSLGKLLLFRMLSGGNKDLFRAVVRAVGKYEVQIDIFMRAEEKTG